MEFTLNLIKQTLLPLSVVVLAACTSSVSEQQKQRQIVDLNVPSEFTSPVKSNEFKIPSVEGKAGKEGDVTAPTTVLVILEGSWVDNEDDHPAKIKVERPELVEQLQSFIEQGINSYVDTNGLSVNKNGDVYQVTHNITDEQGMLFWSEDVVIESFVYNVVVNMEPHGRSGEVFIDVVDYKNERPDLAANQSAHIRTNSFAVQSLNDIMLEMDYLYRVKLKKERSSLNITLALTKDIDGNNVITSQQDITYVWTQLEDIVEDLGFEIEDSDEEVSSYQLVYEKAQESLWSDIFDSDFAGQLPLKNGNYSLTLSSSINGVQLNLKDNLGQSIDQAQTEKLFEIMLAYIQQEEIEL